MSDNPKETGSCRVPEEIEIRKLQLTTETKNHVETESTTSYTSKGHRKRPLRKFWALFAGFWSCFLADGFIFHLSVFFLEFQDEFKKSKAETALVQSVASGTFHIGGIFAGMVTTRFGIFKAGLLGASLEFLGLLISSFATSIPFLVITLGLITGFGTSITYVFATTNIGFHWTGTGTLVALSVAHVGAGIGAITFPFMIEYLSHTYGFRGALLILSALMSHIYLFAISSSGQSNSSLREQETPVSLDKEDPTKTANSIMKTLVSILKEKLFMVYIIASTITQATCIIGLIIFVDYFLYKGFDRSSALLAYLIMSSTSVLVRPLPGLLKKIPHISVLDIQAIVCAIGACSQGLLPFASSFSSHLALASMMGILLGGGVCLVSVCAMKLLDQERFAIGSGISLTFTGILIIVGGPLAGLVRDLTGKYDWVYYGGSILLFLSSCMCTGLSLIRKIEHRKHQTKCYPIEILG